MNIDLGGFVIGWREGLLLLIVLIALYMFVVVWRMRRLGAKAEAPPARPAPQVEPSAGEAGGGSGAVDPGWQAAQARLAQETFMRGMESEVAQLRDEVDALRGELAALRDEMWQELGHMRASQTVSPLYNDAMQMAQLGHDPATIAERCGIARAEAELVVALVKSQNN